VRMQALAKEFRRTLAIWSTQAVPEDVVPFSILTDIHNSWLYCVAGLSAGGGEAGLAWLIFEHLKVWGGYGAITAVLVTFLLHGAFHFIFHNDVRPKRGVYLIRKYVVSASVVLFFAAFATSALARYVSDPNTLIGLLPFFSIALWSGTLSLLVLAAGLFTVFHILRWSRRFDSAYRVADAEKRASEAFLEELGETSTMTTKKKPSKGVANDDLNHGDKTA